jgi:hypothetical protein
MIALLWVLVLLGCREPFLMECPRVVFPDLYASEEICQRDGRQAVETLGYTQYRCEPRP